MGFFISKQKRGSRLHGSLMENIQLFFKHSFAVLRRNIRMVCKELAQFVHRLREHSVVCVDTERLRQLLHRNCAVVLGIVFIQDSDDTAFFLLRQP